MGGHTMIIAAGNLIALLIGQKLLDRVCLLDVGHHPVAYTFPGGEHVTPEEELPPRRVHLQQLGARCMGTMGWVNNQAKRDLHHAVHDDGLPTQHLAVDLIHRQWGIAAGRRPITSTGSGVDRANLRVWIRESPLDSPQFFLLHIENSVREIIELASMIPVAMTDDDLGHVLRLDTKEG